ILSYVEAILRVYNQYGRRDNIYKARIKILVHELGIEKFAKEVEEEWEQIRDSALTLEDSVIEEIRSRFSYPAYDKLPHMPDELNLVLPHVARRDLPALWKALDKIGLATPNINLVSDIIACPGLDYCSLANARSIPIAQELTRRFANHDTANMIGRLHINISG